MKDNFIKKHLFKVVWKDAKTLNYEINFIYSFLFVFFASFNLSSKNTFSITSDIGLTSIDYRYGPFELEKIRGHNYGIQLSKLLYSGMGLTVGFRSIVYNETEKPDNLSLVFTNDMANAVYPSEFFQENSIFVRSS